MSEKEKLLSKRTLAGIAVIVLILGVFLFIAFPFIGISMICIAIGSLIYSIRAERREIATLGRADFVDYLRTKMKKNKGVAIWYDIQEDVPLYKGKAKYILTGNTGRAEGFLLARIAAFMTPKWDVATLIFDFKDWVTPSDIENVAKSAERYLMEKKLKWLFLIINGRGFERPAKDAALNVRTREIGLVLTDPKRNIIVQADTWLSKQLLKIIRLKDFKIIKTQRELE